MVTRSLPFRSIAHRWPLAGAVTLALALVLAPDASAQGTDSLFTRAQQMVSTGNGAAGRALVDSVLAAIAPGTSEYAEGLYWRARLAETAAVAERSYLQIAIEYPLSPRASESLIRLAQLEAARGDRAGAQRHLARLTRDHPGAKPDGRDGLSGARLLFEGGDASSACALLVMTRAGVASTDVELVNQLDYLAPRCTAVALLGSGKREAGSDTSIAAPVPGGDSATVRKPPSRGASRTPASGSQAYSVQIAAYKTREEATVLANRLITRGYAARVTAEAPYRVRIGRYSTRPEAIAALQKMRESNLGGIVVEAEKR